MTTYYLSPAATLIQLLNNSGAILAGGKVKTYVAGSTTPLATKTDSTGVTANAVAIILDAYGRLPASIWVPANTAHKVIITDSADVPLATPFDYIYGINDPTAVLASITALSIANVVASYDTFTSLRAATEPSLGAGQTLIVILEGGSSVDDGLGGAFYWSASSAAADDSFNVIKLTATSGNGRFLRVAWNAKYGIDAVPGMQTLGWLNLPQNTQNGTYGFVLADAGKQVYHSSASTHTYTIPANASIAFPLGTVIQVVNDNGGGNVTIAITTDTLRWFPVGTTGSRTLAANGQAVLTKITTTSWSITGVGVS